MIKLISKQKNVTLVNFPVFVSSFWAIQAIGSVGTDTVVTKNAWLMNETASTQWKGMGGDLD